MITDFQRHNSTITTLTPAEREREHNATIRTAAWWQTLTENEARRQEAQRQGDYPYTSRIERTVRGYAAQ